MSHSGFLIAQQDAGGYRSTTTAQSRQYSHGLRQAYDNRVNPSNLSSFTSCRGFGQFSLIATGCTKIAQIGESQEQSSDHQTDTHHHQAATEDFLYRILQKDTNDAHRDTRHQNLADVIEVIIASESEETLAEFGEHRPEHHDGRQYRSGMHDDAELQIFFSRKIDSEHFLNNLDMST